MALWRRGHQEPILRAMVTVPPGRKSALRFIAYSLVGVAFFILPVPSSGRLTVPFDLAVGWLTRAAPSVVAAYCLSLIVLGAIGSLAATVTDAHPDWTRPFHTSRPMMLVRLAGAPLAIIYMFRVGPDLILQQGVGDLMWNTLAFSVGVIVPIGAALLVLLVRYGFLEFVGTLMEPIMRPLFRLPGRSALDSLTSWVGSYSVGLYLTRQLTSEGFYNRRECYTIVTCFSTVSVGFVAVVAQTLDLLHLFPLIFACYFFAIYFLATVLVRIWPIKGISIESVGPLQYADEPGASGRRLLERAWERALQQAGAVGGLAQMLRKGFTDGLMLAATILGSILTVGTAALLLAKETPVFAVMGRPLVPILGALGLPDAGVIAPAVLVGITEMYIPALLVQDAAIPARFFIAVLSISQLIFFSAVGPMILDMFRDVPVRARDLVALFLMRTALLVPLLAAATAVLNRVGLL